VTKEELDRKLDRLAKKRDYCVDVLGKPLLGLTYQMEIDKLVAAYETQGHLHDIAQDFSRATSNPKSEQP
jgi:hypothetical protein